MACETPVIEEEEPLPPVIEEEEPLPPVIEEEEPIPFSMEAELNGPSSFGARDGSINLIINGGKEPFNIVWFKEVVNRSTSFYYDQYLDSLQSGMYSLTVVDGTGTVFTDSVFLASYDTIYPEEYLPVYPGSYWIYTNGDTIRSSDNYRKTGVYLEHQIFSEHLNNPKDYFPYDSLYLPIWNGWPILSNHRVNASWGNIALIPVIPQEVGKIYSLKLDNRMYLSLIMTESVDTTIVIGDRTFENVIVTAKGTTNWMAEEHFPTGQELGFERCYYAKNIGLIRVENEETEHLGKKEIVEWYINIEGSQ